MRRGRLKKGNEDGRKGEKECEGREKGVTTGRWNEKEQMDGEKKEKGEEC